MSKWLEQYLKNVAGESKEAQELFGGMKKTYKGERYIPWATMERLTYMQDPDADFSVLVTKDKFGVDSLVWTYENSINSTNGIGSELGVSQNPFFVHMVRVSVTFLGKTVVEDYPVQNASYASPNAIDANLVNKAIKRAFAKAAARVTGLAIGLYEKGDLQFEEDKGGVVEDDKPQNTPIVTTNAKKDDDLPFDVGEDKVLDPVLLDLAKYIHNNNDILKGIQQLNSSIFKEHKFKLDISEPVELIADKLSHFKDAEVFVRTLKIKSGIAV